MIYYGDEIGMGDNIYLGDRNGVRTPMQWSPDRNAGFSQANPQQLYLPLIIDHEYHYEAVNVETSRRNPYSLFWWMKRIIALRQQSPIFSRGSLRFLNSSNAKVLAFLRTYQEQSILVVANLSRFSQFVELELAEFRGTTPVELFGQTPFPKIGEWPYLLTLGPHSFYWFAVQKVGDKPAVVRAASTVKGSGVTTPLRVARDWQRVFEEQARRALEKCLARAIPTRRWFSGKAKAVRTAAIIDVVDLPSAQDDQRISLLLVRMEYVDDEPETYLLPLGYATGDAARQMIADASPALVATLQVTHEDSVEEGVLYDAFGGEQMSQALLDIVGSRRRVAGLSGRLVGLPARSFRALRGPAKERLPARALKVEQATAPWSTESGCS